MRRRLTSSSAARNKGFDARSSRHLSLDRLFIQCQLWGIFHSKRWNGSTYPTRARNIRLIAIAFNGRLLGFGTESTTGNPICAIAARTFRSLEIQSTPMLRDRRNGGVAHPRSCRVSSTSRYFFCSLKPTRSTFSRVHLALR